MTIFNYCNVLPVDGAIANEVDAGNGEIHAYDISGVPPCTLTRTITFSDQFSFYAALPSTLVSPYGGMMFLGEGHIKANTLEKRLVVVPLN
jgi:hypothetical protein